MRVLQVHTRYRQPGGEDVVVANEGRLLAEAGHSVDLLEFQNPETDLPAAGRLLLAPWNPGAARRVVQRAAEFEADIVHVHNTWFALSNAVFHYLQRAGIPTVATVHNFRFACVNGLFYRDGHPCEDCLGRTSVRGIVHACYRGSRLQSAVAGLSVETHRLARTWDLINVVVCLTRFAEERLIRAGVDPGRIEIKPNTVPDPGERDGPPSASPIVLFAGRLTEEKGVSDLVSAWDRARPPELTLVVAGSGPLAGTVASRPGVELVGQLDRAGLSELMLRSRAIVLPSRWYEGMPMVLLEALAAGLGAIIPASGPLAEMAGSGGIAYQARDDEDLSRCLQRLTDDDLVDAAGRAARARWSEEFSPERGREQLERVYRLALTRRREGASDPD